MKWMPKGILEIKKCPRGKLFGFSRGLKIMPSVYTRVLFSRRFWPVPPKCLPGRKTN